MNGKTTGKTTGKTIGYVRNQHLKYRVCDDLESVIVFSPETRRFQWLNMSAWQLMNCCDGHSADEVIHAFVSEMASPGYVASEQEVDQLKMCLNEMVKDKYCMQVSI